MSYEYNTFIILRDKKTKKWFWAQDSGCSCPTPFEDYYFNDARDNDLNPITRSTLDELEKALRDFQYADGYQSDLQEIRKELTKK